MVRLSKATLIATIDQLPEAAHTLTQRRPQNFEAVAKNTMIVNTA